MFLNNKILYEFMPTVAFDDIVFERHGLVGTFKAPMGIAITVLDEKKFVEQYDTTLDSLFIEYKKVRKKRIYKAAHLRKQKKGYPVSIEPMFAFSVFLPRRNVHRTFL